MKLQHHSNESGYALLSLLVAMTIGLVVLASMASKPSAIFVGQRENEEEAFFRANQVNMAIQLYLQFKNAPAPQGLPVKLDDLAEKIVVQSPQGISERYLIRKSALIDPLTGEQWKPVRLGDSKIREFARTYMRVMAEEQARAMTSGAGAGVNPAIAGQQAQQQGMPPLLMLAAQSAGFSLANADEAEEKEGETKRPTSASGFTLDLDSDSRPIVGVMSGLKKSMIRNYYGIESYDKALFIPGVQIPGNDFLMQGVGGGVPGGVPGVGGQDPTDGAGAPKISCPPGSTLPICQKLKK